MEEVWKDIKGYEGIYQISSHGNIKRIANTDSIGRRKRSQTRKNQNTGNYSGIKLSKNGATEQRSLHSLVMETFSDAPSCCPTCGTHFEVNHKDFNGKNNRLDNLEYVTRQENVDHAKSKTQRASAKRLDETKAIEIKYLISEGIPYSEISKKYSVSISCISDIANGRLWKHIPDRPLKKPYFKLTAESVKEIKQLLETKTLSNVAIATRYGVTPASICDIKHGRNWASVLP